MTRIMDSARRGERSAEPFRTIKLRVDRNDDRLIRHCGNLREQRLSRRLPSSSGTRRADRGTSEAKQDAQQNTGENEPGAVTATITFPTQVNEVAVNQSTGMIYALSTNPDQLYLVDGASYAITPVATAIESPSGWRPAVDVTTNTLYIDSQQADGTPVLVAVDATTGALKSATPLSTASAVITDIAINAATNTIYAVVQGYGVVVLNGADNSITATLWVASGTVAGEVLMVDGATNTILQTISVGALPEGIAVNETTNTVFVANNIDNTVSVIDGASGTVLQTIALPENTNPISVLVYPTANLVYLPRTDTIVIGVPPLAPTITSGAPASTVGCVSTQFSITATGTAPLSFAITSGSLPTGLSLDPATSAVSGTPTADGTFTYTVTVTGTHRRRSGMS